MEVADSIETAEYSNVHQTVRRELDKFCHIVLEKFVVPAQLTTMKLDSILFGRSDRIILFKTYALDRVSMFDFGRNSKAKCPTL